MEEEARPHTSSLNVSNTSSPLVQTVAAFIEGVVDGSGQYEVQITRSSGDAASRNSITHNGDCWDIHFGSEYGHFPDSPGLRAIATLLNRPGEATSVFVLYSHTDPTNTGNGPVLFEQEFKVMDPDTVKRLRPYLAKLETDLDTATGRGEAEAVEDTRLEIDQIRRYLKAARTPHGIRSFSGEVDQARQAVAQRVLRARRDLAPRMPRLAAHLKQHITISTFCSYSPAIEIDWYVGVAA